MASSGSPVVREWDAESMGGWEHEAQAAYQPPRTPAPSRDPFTTFKGMRNGRALIRVESNDSRPMRQCAVWGHLDCIEVITPDSIIVIRGVTDQIGRQRHTAAIFTAEARRTPTQKNNFFLDVQYPWVLNYLLTA